MTIKELRNKEVRRLVSMHNEYTGKEEEWADWEEAIRLMNSFYRLCGLCESNLYRANDERLCNRPYTKEQEEKEERWYKRLSKQFEEYAGLTLVYCGYMPSIGVRSEHGGFSERITRWFYR